MKTITEKEKALLLDIANSEYQDGGTIVGHAVWHDYIVDSKSKGGVVASLMEKGLVDVRLVAMNKSDNKQAGITDSTIAITKAGVDALNNSPLTAGEGLFA